MTAVLDDVLPVHRHRERHATQIAAAPEVVWSALHAVSAGDLRLTRLLTGIRALPARLPGGRMPGGALPADRTFVEAFLERGYRHGHPGAGHRHRLGCRGGRARLCCCPACAPSTRCAS